MNDHTPPHSATERPIEPAAVDLTARPTSIGVRRPVAPGPSGSRVWAACAICLALVLAVVFILPRLVTQRPAESPAAPGMPASGSAVAPPTAAPVTPESITPAVPQTAAPESPAATRAGAEINPAADADAARRDAAAQHARQGYQTAMDKGFAALLAAQFQTAATAFEQALKIRPGDAAAGAGLTDARSRAAQTRNAELLAQAHGAEQQEDWHSTITHYDAILAQDASVVAARAGRDRATSRAQLHERLAATLATPERLSADNVHRAASALLAEARGTDAPGPRLLQQIAALEQLLTAARTPVALQLRSDNQTHVTVLRVGELGAFERHDLRLNPGRYVALGQRAGYRDVRVEFSLRPGENPAPIVVACVEAI